MRPGFATGMSPDRKSFFVLMAKGEMNKQDIDYHGKVSNLFLMYNKHKGVGGGKEYGIYGRYNWSGSPYNMIIHALQTGTPFV